MNGEGRRDVADPRPDTSGICCRRRGVICPTGCLLTGVSSPICKNISVSIHPKSLLELSPSHPTRGAYHDRHGRGAGCGGRGSVLRARGSQGGFFESVSDQQHADERRLQRTAKSCGPDAPTLASSSRRLSRPYRARTKPNLLTTVAKEPGHRGEHEGNVCRGKARFLRGCKSLPARVAPAGSNRSRREGNELSEAFDGKGH